MDIPLHPSSHTNCAIGLTLSISLYVTAQDVNKLIQKYLANSSHIFAFSFFQPLLMYCQPKKSELCDVVQPKNYCSPAALTSGCPTATLLTPLLSLEHSHVGSRLCLYVPMPASLFCCCFSLSISPAAYG